MLAPTDVISLASLTGDAEDLLLHKTVPLLHRQLTTSTLKKKDDRLQPALLPGTSWHQQTLLPAPPTPPQAQGPGPTSKAGAENKRLFPVHISVTPSSSAFPQHPEYSRSLAQGCSPARPGRARTGSWGKAPCSPRPRTRPFTPRR